MIQYIILVVLTLLLYLMLFAAVASWVPQIGQSKLGYYLRQLTEPIVAPFRYLLRKVSITRELPVDISFLLAFLVIQTMIQLIKKYF